MPTQQPSIELFLATRSRQSVSKPASPPVGDGFTPEEVDAALHPTIDASWHPDVEHAEVDIASLEPGPRCVVVRGRVVNFHNQPTAARKPRAAKGCFKLIIKDDTGALCVRLWYANVSYDLRLGQVVSVWTPHVSNGEHGSLAVPHAPLFTSVFPERDRSCHFAIHADGFMAGRFRTPLGYDEGESLPNLMTLRAFMDGGYDVPNARLLLCVKAVGPRKTITKKNGEPADVATVILFDETADAHLSLWGAMALSAAAWRPSETLLLVSRPGWRVDRQVWMSVTANTTIEVDPDSTPDAVWLRNFVQRMARQEHVNPPFPADLFDFESFLRSSDKMLYTLAEVDELARIDGTKPFIGYLSLVIVELNVMKLHMRKMLFCNECCGIQSYSNATVAKCKHCEQNVKLRINPKALGVLVDETGCMTAGKLVISDRAWAQLFGPVAELADMEADQLKCVEQHLLFLRLTLLFGWTAEQDDDGMGRLYIWGIAA